jgi:hypothetical protein
MASANVSRILLAAAFTLGTTSLAQADVTCVEVKYKTSPIKAGKYENLACSVVNNFKEMIEVEIELVDAYGDDVVEEWFEIGKQEFATLQYKVPDYTGLEAVCEVEALLCRENGQAAEIERVEGLIERLLANPPLIGNLKRRSTNGRQDFASSELRLIGVEPVPSD